MNGDINTNVNQVNDVVEKIEEARKKTVRNLLIMIFLWIIIYFVLFYSIGDVIFSFSYFIFILGLMIIIIKFNSDKRKFNLLYKNNIVLQCFHSSFTEVDYHPDEGISRETIRQTGMMKTGDRFSSSDYLKAKYKDISFECSDVHIENQYTDSDGHTSYSTLFKGQWYIFDFNKPFKSDIEVCENFFGGNKVGSIFDLEKLKKIQLEDVEFHKNFKVYAKEEIDAFYVLTPAMIERIKKLNDEISGKFLFCFCNNKLHIGLYNSKDLYEHSVFSKIDLEKDKEKVLKELFMIINFVDTLKLDNSLFKNSSI